MKQLTEKDVMNFFTNGIKLGDLMKKLHSPNIEITDKENLKPKLFKSNQSSYWCDHFPFPTLYFFKTLFINEFRGACWNLSYDTTDDSELPTKFKRETTFPGFLGNSLRRESPWGEIEDYLPPGRTITISFNFNYFDDTTAKNVFLPNELSISIYDESKVKISCSSYKKFETEYGSKLLKNLITAADSAGCSLHASGFPSLNSHVFGYSVSIESLRYDNELDITLLRKKLNQLIENISRIVA